MVFITKIYLIFGIGLFRMCQMAYLAPNQRIKIGAFSVNPSENTVEEDQAPDENWEEEGPGLKLKHL